MKNWVLVGVGVEIEIEIEAEVEKGIKNVPIAIVTGINQNEIKSIKKEKILILVQDQTPHHILVLKILLHHIQAIKKINYIIFF